MHLDSLIGFALGLSRDPNRSRNAANLQRIADALGAQENREKKRQDMRAFLAERGLQTDDAVLARMGL